MFHINVQNTFTTLFPDYLSILATTLPIYGERSYRARNYFKITIQTNESIRRLLPMPIPISPLRKKSNPESRVSYFFEIRFRAAAKGEKIAFVVRSNAKRARTKGGKERRVTAQSGRTISTHPSL